MTINEKTTSEMDAGGVARIMAEAGDWLAANYLSVAMKVKKTKQKKEGNDSLPFRPI